MTREEQLKILERINKFADCVLPEKDPSKVPIRVQLQALMPEIEKIASELSMPAEDVFIMYMDLNTELSAKADQDLQKYL